VAYTAAAAKTNFPDDQPALVVSRAVRRHLWGVVFFSAFINILALTGSLFMLQVYDRILPSGSVPTLVVLFLLAAALFARPLAVWRIVARALMLGDRQS
jgi:ABC-type protease/lipase transport system fused ATPase/permease subunit